MINGYSLLSHDGVQWQKYPLTLFSWVWHFFPLFFLVQFPYIRMLLISSQQTNLTSNFGIFKVIYDRLGNTFHARCCIVWKDRYDVRLTHYLFVFVNIFMSHAFPLVWEMSMCRVRIRSIVQDLFEINKKFIGSTWESNPNYSSHRYPISILDSQNIWIPIKNVNKNYKYSFLL